MGFLVGKIVYNRGVDKFGRVGGLSEHILSVCKQFRSLLLCIGQINMRILHLFSKAEKAIFIANELHVSFTQLRFSYKKVGGLKPPQVPPCLHPCYDYRHE